MSAVGTVSVALAAATVVSAAGTVTVVLVGATVVVVLLLFIVTEPLKASVEFMGAAVLLAEAALKLSVTFMDGKRTCGKENPPCALVKARSNRTTSSTTIQMADVT